MKNKCFDNQFEIYLFLDNETLETPSRLNEFIAFLKYNKASFPYKFSYVEESPTLMTDMSITQNILIDFNADSLTESRDGQFSEYLKKIDNFYLSQLYARIDIPNELPAMANKQIKKLTGLIKSLVKETEFIFLESPENNLENEDLESFVSALKKQIKVKKQNVFIYSKNVEFWKKHADQIVSRAKDYSFQTQGLAELDKKKLAHEEFYRNNESCPDILNFSIPNKQDEPTVLKLPKVNKIKSA